MAMGDRVMVLHKGYMRQLGTPREVYDTPADTFVATFLGSPPMNLLENSDFIVGFRPEHLLPTELAPNPAIPFRLKVKVTEYLGAEWILYGSVSGGKFDGKEVISRLASASSFAPDQVYDFGVREPDLHFFDRKSEKRTQAKVLAWQ
jgi:multiple sugar transport system ATP-binding protein